MNVRNFFLAVAGAIILCPVQSFAYFAYNCKVTEVSGALQEHSVGSELDLDFSSPAAFNPHTPHYGTFVAIGSADPSPYALTLRYEAKTPVMTTTVDLFAKEDGSAVVWISRELPYPGNSVYLGRMMLRCMKQ